MKILYVITRSERGGAQIHLLDVLKNLPSGCRPMVATGEFGYLADEARQLGVPVHYISHLRQPMSPANDLLALGKIASLIKAQSPDLVHAHTSKAGLLGRLAGWLTGTPTVFTAHTWSFADGISSFQRRTAIPVERLAGRIGGKIITVSRANEEIAAREGITHRANVLTIWNGIPDTDLRAKPGVAEVPKIVMVARFAPQKDQLSLVQALSGLNLPWRLAFVGDGPTRAEVEAEAHKLHIFDRIDFLGDRGDTAQVLANSDLFVLSSKWEGLPLSILEAMRAGLPVITSDVGGCSEAVQHGTTGFLIPPSDTRQLREKLEIALSSKALLKSMGEAGRERFHRDFRIESMMRKLMNVYNEAVSSPGGESSESFIRLVRRPERLVQ
ncbi:MAG: glycosyltransferase family 4 protein [Bryobacteraceae bacterium]